MIRLAFVLAVAIAWSGVAAAQSDENPGSTGEEPENPPAQTPADSKGNDAPPADPKIAEYDRQIALAKKQTELLTEQKNLQVAANGARDAEYPIAQVAVKSGDSSTYEHAAFLADWLLSANAKSLVPKDMPCAEGRTILVVGTDSASAPSLLLAKSIDDSITGLTKATRDWMIAARAEASRGEDKAGSDSNRESAVIDSLMMGQSVVSQTVELLKYFRTDIEFKPVTVSLPTYVLRSELASLCPGRARLPEMAVPTNSELLTHYAELQGSAEALRLMLGAVAPKLTTEMKAAGSSLLSTIDALKTQLTTPMTDQPTLLVQAAQSLSQKNVDRIVTVRVVDEGGVLNKRTNLFFLSPKFSYVAAISVDFVMTDRDTGTVIWHSMRQARSQMDQKFSPWHGKDVDSLESSRTKVP